MKLSYKYPICPHCNTDYTEEIKQSGNNYVRLECAKCGLEFGLEKKTFPSGRLVFKTKKMEYV